MTYNEAIITEVRKGHFTLQSLDSTGTIQFNNFDSLIETLDFCKELGHIQKVTLTLITEAVYEPKRNWVISKRSH